MPGPGHKNRTADPIHCPEEGCAFSSRNAGTMHRHVRQHHPTPNHTPTRTVGGRRRRTVKKRRTRRRD